MPKTRFERLDAAGPGIAVFRISGQLGFHENQKVEQLTQECLRRSFKTVVFDFSELSSLGGGVARILRDFVKVLGENGGAARFVITNSVILDFLRDGSTAISVFPTLEEAMGEVGNIDSERLGKTIEVAAEAVANMAEGATGRMAQGAAEQAGQQTAPRAKGKNPGVILMSYDGESIAAESLDASMGEDRRLADDRPSGRDEEGPGSAGDGGGSIISEIFEADRAGADSRPERGAQDRTKADAVCGAGPIDSKDEMNRALKRHVLELKTLFSISSDFNGIKDRKKLIDIFLLTSIAQGGVESAVFFEKKGKKYEPMIMKGLDSSSVEFFGLSNETEKRISGNPDVRPISVSPIQQDVCSALGRMGLEYLCPFNTSEGLVGLVFLGKRITGRGMQKEDFEFLRILINIARGAYENALIIEREHERTLGIVKTLISLIEENTLLTGTSEFVSRYVGMVAKNMDYPDEHFKDLIYGTVLRDMGMIKVSDLILRSPRELTREEWNIINKHPEDGAEMLKRMRFNDHVVNIVLSHHERFNGEGYPRGLRGKEIPLGSRIISVVESYSAMIHERPNRPALSEKEALDTLKENYGLRYDREVVRQFSRIMEKEIARSVRPGIAVS